MPVEGNGFTEHTTMSEGSIETGYPITSGQPRASFQKSDQFGLAPGNGADTYGKAGLVHWTVGMQPEEIQLGALVGSPLRSVRAADEPFSLKALRYWAVYNYSDQHGLWIWGGVHTPVEYPGPIMVLPRTTANPGVMRAGAPNGQGIAIGPGTAMQVQANTGQVELLFIVVGE